eukprot:m.161080 g.161080  ORF g.161080 m.161080 type:complete len:184 (+) comp16372_c0_seq2:447-998(+)
MATKNKYKEITSSSPLLFSSLSPLPSPSLPSPLSQEAIAMPPKFRKVGLVDDPSADARRTLLEESDEEIFDFRETNQPNARTKSKSDGSHADPALQRARREVDEAVDIMRQNIGKVLDRGGRLDDLEDKSEVLMQGAFAFQRGSRRLTRELWWKRTRARIIIGLIITAVLGLIILVFVLKSKH